MPIPGRRLARAHAGVGTHHIAKKLLCWSAALGAALLLALVPARAQSFGLLGGVTKSYTSTSFGRDNGGGITYERPEGERSDYTLGLFLSRRLTSALRAEVDPMFVTKGDDENGAGLTIRYLDLPVLAHLNVIGGDKSADRFFLSAGPGFNTVLSCGVAPGLPFNCNTSEFDTRRFELSGVIGFGAELAANDGTSIGVDVRYEQSLTNTGLENNGGKRVNHTALFLLRLGLY